jgi:hypothetical protein
MTLEGICWSTAFYDAWSTLLHLQGILGGVRGSLTPKQCSLPTFAQYNMVQSPRIKATKPAKTMVEGDQIGNDFHCFWVQPLIKTLQPFRPTTYHPTVSDSL